jgi:hypothetical protein
MADQATTESKAGSEGAAAGSAASGASGAGAGGAAAGAGAGNPPVPAAVTQEGATTFVTALKGDQRTAFLKAINAAEPVAAPVVPEKYTLKLPEKSLLDATATERTTAIARTLGLSNDDSAQKVLDFTNQEVASAVEATMKAYQPGGAEWTAQVDQWKKAALADPELGNGKQETLDAAATKAKAVLDRFFPESVKQFLHSTGYGANPDLVKALLGIAKAQGEGSFVTGAPGGGTKKSTADVLYGDSPTTSGVTQ